MIYEKVLVYCFIAIVFGVLSVILVFGVGVLDNQLQYERALHDKQNECVVCESNQTYCYEECTMVGRGGQTISFATKPVMFDLARWGK